MENNIALSSLGHTWILDIDGTVVKHNGYKIDGEDSFLPGAKEFLQSIPEKDEIIFITSRNISFKEITESFLIQHGIRFKTIIYDMPYGERILINDKKPSGLNMSVSVNTDRNIFMSNKFFVDESL